MGVLLALTGALGFSFMNVFIRNGVRRGDPDNGVVTTMLINVGGFALLLTAIAVMGGLPEVSGEAAAWFAASGVFTATLGRQALFGGIRRIGAARAAAIKNATPLVALVIAFVTLGERLSLVDGLGALLILAGLFALIVESVQSAPALEGEPAPPDPVATALASEGLAEAGFLARTVTRIAAGSRRVVALGVAMSVASALFIGAGHVLRKVGMNVLPHAVVGGAVAALTGLLLVLAVEALRGTAGQAVRSSLSVRPWFWAAGAAGTVGQLSFFAALAFAPVSHVSVVAGSETVLTVIIAALLAGRIEAITRRVVLPAVLVFAGTALIGLASA